MARRSEASIREVEAPGGRRDIFESVSPVDFRYWDPRIAGELSENAFNWHKLDVEFALIQALVARGNCPPEAISAVERAIKEIQTGMVYEEERRIKHDIRALVNLIRERVPNEIKPYIHMTATSYDIVDTANAARYRDAIQEVFVPELKKFLGILIKIAIREADTIQIVRTHGQHAVPITFGFAMAGYVSRLGQSINALIALSSELRGKFSGAVGAYNASSLFFEDPEEFEKDVLKELNLLPAECSTQIVPPEPVIRLYMELVITAGILANLADDMRNLQRTEIGEIGEEFELDQVGSSTMPQKRNPINFENVKSQWKVVMPRIITVLLDQISEHQRDLTNSASSRTYGELIAYVYEMAKRMTRTMAKMRVDRDALQKNFSIQQDLIIAEPLYIILARLGHPDAHEKVRQLTLKAQRDKKSLSEIVSDDPEMAEWMKKMVGRQKAIIADPTLYVGIAAKKARTVAEQWQRVFSL